MRQNIYSEFASKKPRQATASKCTISHQNKYFKKLNVYQVEEGYFNDYKIYKTEAYILFKGLNCDRSLNPYQYTKI